MCGCAALPSSLSVEEAVSVYIFNMFSKVRCLHVFTFGLTLLFHWSPCLFRAGTLLYHGSVIKFATGYADSSSIMLLFNGALTIKVFYASLWVLRFFFITNNFGVLMSCVESVDCFWWYIYIFLVYEYANLSNFWCLFQFPSWLLYSFHCRIFSLPLLGLVWYSSWYYRDGCWLYLFNIFGGSYESFSPFFLKCLLLAYSKAFGFCVDFYILLFCWCFYQL